ncbi:MAG: diguanylate cyclase [Burkholderiales bacterium]
MKQRLNLLIVERTKNDTARLLEALRGQGFLPDAVTVGSAQELRAALEAQIPELILCDQPIPGFAAAEALAIAREASPELPLIIVSAEADLNMAVALMRLGAQDYVKDSELARLGPSITRELREAEQRRRQRETERRLHESQELFRAIVENVGDLVAVLDTNGKRVYNNPSYRPLFREKDIREGSSSFREIHPDDRERIRDVFRRTVETGIGECAEFRFMLKDGSIRYMESDGRPICDADGKVTRVVVVSRDITEQKQLEADLREMAATDILTGLPNRRHYLAQLGQEIARVDRSGEHSASVLMIDVDHFKRINDTHGHSAGDHALRHLSRQMQQALRRVDTLGRLGGEEFAVILPGADGIAAENFAERLRKKIATSPALYEDHTIPLSISIGVTELKPSDTNADDVLMRADRALYRAKSGGRNRVAVEP